MSLLNYVVKRLLATIPIVIGVLFITFILVRQMKGSPYAIFGSKITPEQIWEKEEELGLHEPILIQFWLFLKNVIIKGDWGDSISTSPGQAVWELMWEKVPKTLEIQVTTTILSSYIGIRMGVFSAINHNNWKDTMMRFFSFLFYSMPIFWLAILVKTLFTQVLPWFPSQGYITMYYLRIYNSTKFSGFGLFDTFISGKFYLWFDIVKHLFLPIFVLVIGSMAGLTRYVRSSMLEVLELDFVRSARAKGCKERDVVNKHALRNSMIPTVTLIGMNFGFLIVGSTLTEYTFNIYGTGQLYLDSITNRDYFLIQAMVVLITGTVMISNLITDILYGVLDPRIRL